ncbi:MAG: hypothetical protein IPG04_17065 [Polyangiaceae bacterium]|nr:hypothetical protein [Polyangiaceae bacterium]
MVRSRLKSDIAFRFAVQMGRGEFNPQELRLLAWLLRDLRLSEFADVVIVSETVPPDRHWIERRRDRGRVQELV